MADLFPVSSDPWPRSPAKSLLPRSIPPPPPNQIVLVRYPKGVPLPDIYEPYWVIGTLHTEAVDNALAEASYTLDASKVRKVEESDL